MNLEQLIFTWKGQHLVLALVASRQMIVALSLCYPYCALIRDATYCFVYISAWWTITIYYIH